MTPLHFEVWQLALFFVAMGMGLAEIGDKAAEEEVTPRARAVMYVVLLFAWWLVIPLAGALTGLGRWTKQEPKQKGKGPWG